MEHWFHPYESKDRGEYIQETILRSGALLFGRATYEMLAPYWSGMKKNEFGIADWMNRAPKYIVSSTLRGVEWNNATITKGDLVEFFRRFR